MNLNLMLEIGSGDCEGTVMVAEAWILTVGVVVGSFLIGLGIESGAKIIAEAINPPIDQPTTKELVIELEKMPRPDPRGETLT